VLEHYFRKISIADPMRRNSPMNWESYNRECDGSNQADGSGAPSAPRIAAEKIKAIMVRAESFAEASADLSPRRRYRGSDRQAISEKCRAAMDATRAFCSF
jgi:hypothetical protein